MCQRRMYESTFDASKSDWGKWFKVLEEFKQYIESTRSMLMTATGPLAKFQDISARKILISMQLLLRRPPYRQPRNVVPPWDDINILQTATDVLKEHMQPLSPELAPWAWKNWVQWHALAIVLAELVAQPHGDLSDQAYTVATQSFMRYASIVADGDSGMLWKPIARLMRRVQHVRQLLPPITSQLASSSLTSHEISDHLLQPRNSENWTESFNIPNFNDWNLGPDVLNLFPCGASQTYDQIDSTHTAEDMSWVAWDCFLQDLNFSNS